MNATIETKAYVCNAEGCRITLTQAEAWVPAATAIRRALGRFPRQVKDLVDHVHCGRCAHRGRKAGLKFHRLVATVAWMDQGRVERLRQSRRVFEGYLPKDIAPSFTRDLKAVS
jgi:hypothetical protein